MQLANPSRISSKYLLLFVRWAVSADLHAARYRVQFDLYAMSDSTGYIRSHPPGSVLTPTQVASAMKHKHDHQRNFAQQSLGTAGDALTMVKELCEGEHRGKWTIVVDASGSDATTPALLHALQLGCGIALANKKPLTQSMEVWERLMNPEWRHRVRFESTVGAGTPFIACTQRTINSGDVITQIQGSFSGTLGYVMSGLEAGGTYSGVVSQATKLGYTEPDPRDDLGGVDVARKALILARLLGWKAEMSDVGIEPLYPKELEGLSVPEFLAQLHTMDAAYASKVAQAKSDGYVLRYAANVEGGKISVGLLAVQSTSPLGRLQDTENLLELHTLIYGQKPLVIQGAGAGGAITAVGILGDMIELVGTLPTQQQDQKQQA
jgi:homoserine dehydrogenase